MFMLSYKLILSGKGFFSKRQECRDDYACIKQEVEFQMFCCLG